MPDDAIARLVDEHLRELGIDVPDRGRPRERIRRLLKAGHHLVEVERVLAWARVSWLTRARASRDPFDPLRPSQFGVALYNAENTDELRR